MYRFAFRFWAAIEAVLTVCPLIVSRFVLHRIAPHFWGKNWRSAAWPKSVTIEAIFDTITARM